MNKDFENLIAYTDGGCRGNPGPSACAVWFPQLGEVSGYFIPNATNNQAEYHALILAINLTKKLGMEKLKVYTDSQLMQRQMTGRYAVRAESVMGLWLESHNLAKSLASFEIFHIRRSANREADEECNRIMDEEGF